MLSKPKSAVFFVICAFALTACSGGGIVSSPPTGTATIAGALTDTRGGPPLSGAIVAVENTTLTATTDANGMFSITGVAAATYNLLMTRAGYGVSRMQGVVVSAGATTDVRMHMRRFFDPTKPVTAPSIAVSGLSTGATVSGTVSFTITVSAANPMFRIEVRFGHRGDVANVSIPDASSSTVSWGTASNANGATFVNIIAYDNNYNLAEWSIPVTVNNSPSGGIPATPTSAFATAVTFGRPVGVFRAQREALAQAGRLFGEPGRLKLRDGRSLNIMAAPADSTQFVYILWSPVAGATGYKLYRSFSAAGPFTLLADAGAGVSADCSVLAFGGMTQCHRDSSSELGVGTSVFYRVTAYTATGESPQSATAGTTPLAAFNLNLTTPIDEATGIPSGGIGTQTFSYAPVTVVGTLRHYEGRVAGLNDDPSTWWPFCVNNVTTITYGTGACPGSPPAIPLQRAKRYEWDVTYAFAYATYSSGDAYSMAGFRPGSPTLPLPPWSTGSLNGPFRFTTVP